MIYVTVSGEDKDFSSVSQTCFWSFLGI